MSAPFNRALAIEAIERTMSRYLSHIDAKEWDRLAGLFAPGATVTLPHYETPLSAPEAIAGFRRSTAGATTVHAAFMSIFSFQDESRAYGRWNCAYRVYRPLGDSRVEHSLTDAVGCYENDYVLTAKGTWDIGAIRLRVARTSFWERIERVADDAIAPAERAVL